MFFFFFKQKTAYELRISDWSSDVSSSDLRAAAARASLPRCRDMPRSFALRIARRRPLAHDEAGLHDGDDRCALVLRDLPGYRRRGGTRAVNAEGERDEVGPVGQREGNEVELGRAHV